MKISDLPLAQTESLSRGTAQRQILLLGQCSAGPLSDKFPRGWTIHHHLVEAIPSSFPPEVDYAAYDGAVVVLTLRHILAFADPPGGNAAAGEMMWAKLIGTPQMEGYFEACKEYLRAQVRKYHDLSEKTPTFFLTFFEPRQNYFGIFGKKYSLDNPVYFVRELNRALEEAVAELPQAYCIESNEALNAVGRSIAQDDIFWHIGHASYTVNEFVAGKDEDQRLQKALEPTAMYEVAEGVDATQRLIVRMIVDAFTVLEKKAPVKLIIVDLDDTMWRGVAADGDKPAWERLEGWPKGVIEALLIFKARGGMLAICSKNDERETRERFNAILQGQMELDDFVALAINFGSKSENIRGILEAVNILPDNAVFIDDNPREIEEVKRVFPTLRMLSRQHYDWRRVILTSPETQVEQLSEESRARTQTVRAAIVRRNEQAAMPREEWIRSLDIRQRHVAINAVTHPNFNRAAELINKTNQFNTNGQRWTVTELTTFFKQGGVIIGAFMADRLTDNGLIGCVMVRGAEVVQAVLSCRVFGFAVEQAMLRVAMQYVLRSAPTVRARIRSTGKNHTCHAYFLNAGFEERGESADGERLFEASTAVAHPDWIRAVFSTQGLSTLEEVRETEEGVLLRGRVANEGSDIWAPDAFPINISYHLYDTAGERVLWDGVRMGLDGIMLPGEVRRVEVAVPAQEMAMSGVAQAAIEPVHEMRLWFSDQDFAPQLMVLPRAAASVNG